MEDNKRIIAIDDDDRILRMYKKILAEKYDFTAAMEGEEGFRIIKDAREKGCPFALAFIDILMPIGWDGVKAAKEIRGIDFDIEFVLVTACDEELNDILERVGGTPRGKLLYLRKPFHKNEISQFALCLTRKWNLELEAKRKRKSLLSAVQIVTSYGRKSGDTAFTEGYRGKNPGRLSTCERIAKTGRKPR